MAQYGYTRTVGLPFGEAVAKVQSTFKEAGFGVLCDIDVKEKFKEKLGIDYASYRILGMCNPSRAHAALEADPEIGLLLPCNIVVYERDGAVIVSAILPTALLAIVDNPEAGAVAEEIEGMIKQAIDAL